MSIELTCLLWSTALGLAYVMTQATALQAGARGKIDPKRDNMPNVPVYAARADRALRNFIETYPLFVALVAVAELSARHGAMTAYGAVLYVVARLVYLPLYIFGLAPVRSLSWALSIAGIVIMFLGIAI